MHNNSPRLNLRREVVGKKNWLFCGSDDGAEVNAVFVSLLASCALHRIEPLSYIRDLLCLLPRWPRSRVLELAPADRTRLSSSARLSRPSTPKSSARWCSGCRATPSIALQGSRHLVPLSAMSKTERLRQMVRRLAQTAFGATAARSKSP
jgi:hypothetical protein